MNISLAPKKKKKSKVSYGLNKRGEPSNVFGGVSEEEEDNESESLSDRDRVNQKIAREQAALRKRAQAAGSGADPSVYDYDGPYDDFTTPSAPAKT